MRKTVALAALLFGLVGCERSDRLPQPVRHYAGDNPVVGHSADVVVALVRDIEDNKEETFCAGVWVTEHVILTARHCIAASVGSAEYTLFTEGMISLDLNNVPLRLEQRGLEVSFRGESFGSNEPGDLGLIEVKHPPPHEIAKIAARSPKLGDVVHIIGHPDKREWTYSQGYMGNELKLLDKTNTAVHVEQITATGIYGGSSGGGAFDEYGNLVGICTSISERVPGQTHFIHLMTIKSFIFKNLVLVTFD